MVIIGQLWIPGVIDSDSKGHALSPLRISCRKTLYDAGKRSIIGFNFQAPIQLQNLFISRITMTRSKVSRRKIQAEKQNIPKGSHVRPGASRDLNGTHLNRSLVCLYFRSNAQDLFEPTCPCKEARLRSRERENQLKKGTCLETLNQKNK